MSYYRFNRQEILQKVKERYSKEKAAEYYLKNKEGMKSQQCIIKSFNKKKKTRLRSTQKKNIKNCFGIKKEALKSNFFLFSIKRMNEKTLKFKNIRVNKKKFHKSKKPIDLMSVNTERIVTPEKIKHRDEGFKYFIGYQEDKTVKPLCIILPQMKEYIKYFKNDRKNMSLMVKDVSVLSKYNEIWNRIKFFKH